MGSGNSGSIGVKVNMNNLNKKKAVIILSGGLDSTTCMGIAEELGYSLFPLTFDYGQRHRIELINARKVADHYGVGERMKLITLPFLRDFGGSALRSEEHTSELQSR